MVAGAKGIYTMTDNKILEKVKLRWQELKALNLSEIDTQVLLVEPILIRK